MKEALAVYFGFAEDTRPQVTYLSWQQLTYVTAMVVAALIIGIVLGRRSRKKPFEKRITSLKVMSVVMVACELLKIAVICLRVHDISQARSLYPLFLCSIMLFALSIAAFAKGRLQKAALDFSIKFGFLCMVAGTYPAANMFPSQLLKFELNVSTVTHCLSGMGAAYIASAGLVSMEKRNRGISYAILVGFEILALAADLWQRNSAYQSNYMFFMQSDGTPFIMYENFCGGTGPLYTILAFLTYPAYLLLFDTVYSLIKKRPGRRKKEAAA